MNEIMLDTISEIVGSMNIGELHTLFTEQIINEEEDYISPVFDQFQPIYRNFLALSEIKEEDQDDVQIAREQFFKICRSIINLITEKFNIIIDPDYLDDNTDKVPGLTLSLYTFFILDFYSVVYEMIRNYLAENLVELSETFKFNTQNKDAVSNAYRKIFSEDMTNIVTNIYDISEYILSSLDPETVFEYLDEGYAPALILKVLYQKGVASGDFVRAFADIYKVNIPLKSKVCFDIINIIKTGQIKDIFKDLMKEEEEE